jgi:hypothetical protein
MAKKRKSLKLSVMIPFPQARLVCKAYHTMPSYPQQKMELAKNFDSVLCVTTQLIPSSGLSYFWALCASLLHKNILTGSSFGKQNFLESLFNK